MSNKRIHLWCLIDKRTNMQLEALLYDEARAIICSVPSKELENWYAWREGWPEWRSVVSVEGLTESMNRSMSEEIPDPPFHKTSGPQGIIIPAEDSDSDPEISLKSLVIEKTGTTFSQVKAEDVSKEGFVVRRHRRFDKRYEVQIYTEDNQFVTHSVDISVGGILIEDSLPEWVSGYFKVRIRKPNHKHQIELTCCLVENQEPTKHVRLLILPFEHIEDEKNLEVWLAA